MTVCNRQGNENHCKVFYYSKIVFAFSLNITPKVNMNYPDLKFGIRTFYFVILKLSKINLHTY